MRDIWDELPMWAVALIAVGVLALVAGAMIWVDAPLWMVGLLAGGLVVGGIVAVVNNVAGGGI